MADPAILTEKLTKQYGRRRGLAGLDLSVTTGEVFGFLGPNGAGKTTTIRLLLDLIRPSGGTMSVLGLDPGRDGVALRRRIGYLPGEFTVDGRQSARELLTYLGNLRGGVAAGRIRGLADRLELDLSARIRSLSRGNRQKVGLIQAFMHEPELLIFDEPTSGLDPLQQQEFVAMVRQARAAGQTVFMSSHVMSEVQQTADRVGIIREGRLVAVEQVEALREQAMRTVEVHFAEPVAPTSFMGLRGVSDVAVTDGTLHCRLVGRADGLVKALAQHPVISLLVEEPDLEEIFVTYYREETVDVAAR
jgi:ABC-2 type transport system ATP-binding protein